MGRRLGQHFLNRDSILTRIAAAVSPAHEPLIIEIGPGGGALTRHLLPRAGRLIAIETDSVLAGRLREKFAGWGSLTVVHADVLEADLGQWGPAVVAGNLPYYITSPILRKTFALGPLLRRAVFLVQREVAERLTAVPGSRQYGFLTVLTRVYAEPEILFRVSREAFRPPPKVDSAVVLLRPVPEDRRIVPGDPEPFLNFVGRCFRLKRKTIRNNLAGTYGKAALDGCPEASLRAEQLSPGEFEQLRRRLSR